MSYKTDATCPNCGQMSAVTVYECKYCGREYHASYGPHLCPEMAIACDEMEVALNRYTEMDEWAWADIAVKCLQKVHRK